MTKQNRGAWWMIVYTFKTKVAAQECFDAFESGTGKALIDTAQMSVDVTDGRTVKLS